MTGPDSGKISNFGGTLRKGAFAAFASIFLVPTALAEPRENSMADPFIRSGLYVLVGDTRVSSEFYERVFLKTPSFRSSEFVAFDVAGGLFAVALRSKFDAKATYGTNVVPYIRVRSAEVEFERLRHLMPKSLEGRTIVREGPLTLFKFADPDGNVIEFFSMDPPVQR